MTPEAASVATTTETAKPTLAPARPAEPEHVPPAPRPDWQKYLTPVLVVLLAAAVVFTIFRNWNSWEGGKAEQVTDDAYVRGDLTPLSTKVAGIVREVRVSDFQTVHRGDLLVQLDDDDYRAQVAQASAAVAAAKAAIENNRRQKQLQQAKIDRALAGVAQAQAEIAGRKRESRPRRPNWTALFPNAAARRLSLKLTPLRARKLSKWWPTKNAPARNS